MDTRTEPGYKKIHIADDVADYKSVSERYIINPLIANKGFTHSFAAKPQPQISIAKMSTELDLTESCLVINKDVMERHERFMNGSKDKGYISILSSTNGNISGNESSPGLQIIPESEEVKEAPKKQQNTDDISKLFRHMHEQIIAPSNYSEQSVENSVTKKSIVKEERETKEELTNESFRAKEDTQYIANYVINRYYREQLTEISKLAEKYKIMAFISQRIGVLCSMHLKSLSRNLKRYENGM